MRTNDAAVDQFHNSGFEYLKLIYQIKDTQGEDSSERTSPHFLPLLALQTARLAIEGYVDQVGRGIDLAWDESYCDTASIKERIATIYNKTGKPVEFKKGIWEEALTLFDMAGLIQKNLAEFKNAREEEIPESYKDVARKYPVHLSLAIAEQAVEALLTCSNCRVNPGSYTV